MQVESLALSAAGASYLQWRTLTQRARAGGSIVLRSIVPGVRPLHYQWQFNGTVIDGATNLTLTLNDLAGADAGVYQVIASNALGSQAGSAVRVTVLGGPLLFDVAGLRLSNGELQLQLLGASGLGPITLYSSTNLQTWSAVSTNSGAAGPIDFVVPGVTNSPTRFYRAVELDEP